MSTHQSQTKACVNCSQNFTIEPEDFSFYERVKVPAPTWCPECRLVRRMSYRNERTLYKTKCQAQGHNEEVISVFSPDKPDRIYCASAWDGDGWDPMAYGRDYDFSISFFEQMRELWKNVPDKALFNINPVNSDYCSITQDNKNCYLVIGGDFNEDSLYSSFILHSKECMDCLLLSKCEKNYETIDCNSCFNLKYSRYCETSYDSAFLFNCRNCHDCFGCVNLVSKQYCIWNVQYSKEEYFEKLKEIDLRSYSVVQKIREEFHTFSLKFPRRFAKIIKSVDVSGDFIEEAKKCTRCFSVFGGAENSKNLWLIYSQVKDSHDIDHSGLNSIECYDSSSVYPGNQVLFSRFIWDGHHIEYSYNCTNCSYIFGCVGLKNKKYCILNKQYTKEEYEKIRESIVNHMMEHPYIDRVGRVYKYGEFFPVDLSPFAYNETVSMEINPLSKADIESLGYKYKEDKDRNYKIEILPKDLPDNISEIDDSIINVVIGCEHDGLCNDSCTKAFKITEQEFAFYKNYNIPVPKLCPNCRYVNRLKEKNPLKLWHRACMHEGCGNEFETSYSPDRPEIVYCERCYQQEVY